jgi:glutamyl-tRNA reductase
LQDHLETIRQAEIDRVRGRLGPMTADQELAVEALTRGIVNKIMHTPISTLKTAARASESTTVIELVRRLFNLHDNVQGQLHDNQREEDDMREAGVAKSQRKVEARNRDARKGGTGD